jgi:hydroxymethylglutaryl-CoA lyase
MSAPKGTPDGGGHASGLPRAVRVREVGPRDGFQNEPEVIATERKIELIDALARTGLRRLEVTSFVRADVIPQLADAAQVLAGIAVPAQVSVSVLIPNERGLDTALELRERIDGADGAPAPAVRAGAGGERAVRTRPAFDEINVFMSASETHNRKNVNRSIEESLAGLRVVLGRARAEGLRCEGVISTSFGCPYEGHVAPERVLEIACELRDAGAQEIGFGDTTGMANPVGVRDFFAAARARLGDEVELTAHFHNTRGQGMANVLAALDAGVESFESSFGELGGCPVPAGATGNIASEDLVSMLHEMGIETGVELPALLSCAQRVQEILGRRLGSHTLVAGPVDWRG